MKLKKFTLLFLLFAAGFVYSQTINTTSAFTRNNQRTEEDAKILIDTLYQKLLRGENFERLAIIYSDDKSVERNNGEIGWTNAGSLVPEYEEAASKLKPGEISEPFKTQFGFHIVQLLDKEEGKIKTRHILIAHRS